MQNKCNCHNNYCSKFPPSHPLSVLPTMSAGDLKAKFEQDIKGATPKGTDTLRGNIPMRGSIPTFGKVSATWSTY